MQTHKSPTPTSFSRVHATIFAMAMVFHPGCVALNIPSQRLHDASDQGGLFGHWNDAKHRQPDLVGSIPGMPPESVERAGMIAQQAAIGSDPSFAEGVYVSDGDGFVANGDCHACDGDWVGDCDAYDPLAADRHEPPAPEIPWPKYHPVPTRPVFAPIGVY